ncbi:MAG: chemotaxis protein CheB [Deltaproteobacteria bacterium]|nr:chemotaxis protein CheB [Deltaproteobacteria bacterium]
MTLPPAPQIIAVGASAGGLKALTDLFTSFPRSGRFAFVVVQHLSPHFKSVMRDLMEKVTSLAVVVAEDDMVIEVDTVYLNSPHSDLSVEDGRLRILPWPEQATGPRFPIDVLFRSLVAEVGDKAIAVVLSGTGSDGSRGMAEVHDAGGLTVVQRPDTAQFEGMPDAALRATTCNLVLPPKEMGQALLGHLEDPVPATRSGVHHPLPLGACSE